MTVPPTGGYAVTASLQWLCSVNHISEEKKISNVDNKRPSNSYLLCITLLTVFSIILRFRDLDDQSMWVDELATLNSAMMPEWIDAMGTGQSMFGFGGWLIWHLLSIIGHSDFAARSISAVSGAALIPLLSEAGRRTSGSTTGLIAGALGAANHLMVYYSQEFRPYMLGSLILWAGILLALHAERKRPKVTFAAIACLAFSFTLHYLAGLAVVLALLSNYGIRTIQEYSENNPVENKIQRLRQHISSPAGQALMMGVSIAALVLLATETMISDSSSDMHSQSIQETPDDAHLVLMEDYFGFIDGIDVGGFEFSNILWALSVGFPLLAIIRANLEGTSWIERPEEWVYFAIGIGSFGTVILYSANVRPLFLIRYMLFAMPAFILIISISIRHILAILSALNPKLEENANQVMVGIVALVLTASTHHLIVTEDYYDSVNKSDFKGMAEELDELKLGQEAYIISGPSTYSWNLYLSRMGSDERVNAGAWGNVPSWAKSNIENSNYTTIVYVLGHSPDSFLDDGFIEDLETMNYTLQETKSFYRGEMMIYHLDPCCEMEVNV